MIPSLRRHQESLETNPNSSKLWPDKKQFGYQHPGTRYWDTLDGICGDVDWDWTVDVVVYNNVQIQPPYQDFVHVHVQLTELLILVYGFWHVGIDAHVSPLYHPIFTSYVCCCHCLYCQRHQQQLSPIQAFVFRNYIDLQVWVGIYPNFNIYRTKQATVNIHISNCTPLEVIGNK
jgi:hypothetical protein